MKSTKKGKMDAILKAAKVKGGPAQCPRCKSVRLQRGYKHTPMLFRLVRRHDLLCNNCGLEFKEFGVPDELTRTPSTKKESLVNRRRAPRYTVHIPVTISLAEKSPSGKLIFSKASRGHCDVISKLGMAFSFVGSKFDKRDFLNTGRLLFVVIMLPKGPVDALVTTVTHQRVVTDEGKPTWFIAATITKMSEGDTAKLVDYLNEKAKRAPVLLQE